MPDGTIYLVTKSAEPFGKVRLHGGLSEYFIRTFFKPNTLTLKVVFLLAEDLIVQRKLVIDLPLLLMYALLSMVSVNS